MGNNGDYLKTDEGAIHYRTNPGKPFIVFVHGHGGDINGFVEQRKFFRKKGFGTLVYDQRGCGESLTPLQSGSYSLEAYAGDLEKMVRVSGEDSFTLVAQSSGTMVSQHFAYHHPEVVDGLVLIAPLFDTDENLSRSTYGKALNRGKPVIRALTRLLEELPPLGTDGTPTSLDGTGPVAGSRYYFGSSKRFRKVLRLRLEALLDWDVRSLSEKIQVPTLLIHGRDDVLISPDVSRELKQIMPDPEFHLIAGDHQAQITNPDEVNRLVDRFLASRVYADTSQ